MTAKLVSSSLYKPSHVNFIFSLRDQDNHAISVPPEDLKIRVFEDTKEIDYRETALFLEQSESFELEMVLVLDYTNSMKASNGIATMIEGAKAAINALPETHRIGLVEYHDRNVEPRVLQALTSNKSKLIQALDDNEEIGYLSGSSLCWDAVYKGLSLFTPADEELKGGKNISRALIFLSDGRDTSSTRKPTDIKAAAQKLGAQGTQIYVVGLGDVYEEAVLRDTAVSTHGEYYRSSNTELIARLDTLASDLRGQYIVKYVTLQTSGSHDIKFEVTHKGLTATLAGGKLDLGSLYTRGSDLVGLISVDQPNVYPDKVEAFVRARHIPREVSTLKFRFDTSKPVSLFLPPHAAGGLLEGWQVQGPDSAGWFMAESPNGEPLAFGNSGVLFQVTIGNVTESSLKAPLILDKTIYRYGQSFQVDAGAIDIPKLVRDVAPGVPGAGGAGAGPAVFAAAAPPETVRWAAQRISPFVVQVRGDKNKPAVTGIMMDGETNILTDCETARGLGSVEISWNDGSSSVGTPTGRDDYKGLQIVKLSSSRANWPVVVGSATVKPGDTLVAVMFSKGDTPSATVVNVASREYNRDVGANVIKISPGIPLADNKGAPLVNLQGQVVGVLAGQDGRPIGFPALKELNLAIDTPPAADWLLAMRSGKSLVSTVPDSGLVPDQSQLLFSTVKFRRPANWTVAKAESVTLTSPSLIEVRLTEFVPSEGRGIVDAIEKWQQSKLGMFSSYFDPPSVQVARPPHGFERGVERFFFGSNAAGGTYFRARFYSISSTGTILIVEAKASPADYYSSDGILRQILDSVDLG